MEAIRITSKGQLTLPKACREALGIKQGDILQVERIGNDRLVLKVTKSGRTERATRREGIVRRTAGLLGKDELDQAYIDQLRKESSYRLQTLYERDS